jgi:hypothetical protein
VHQPVNRRSKLEGREELFEKLIEVSFISGLTNHSGENSKAVATQK